MLNHQPDTIYSRAFHLKKGEPCKQDTQGLEVSLPPGYPQYIWMSAIKGMVARKAAYCSDEGLRTCLAEAIDGLRTTSEANGTGAPWLQADIHLHRNPVRIAGNERAHRTIATLNDQWHGLRSTSALQEQTRNAQPRERPCSGSMLTGDGDERRAGYGRISMGSSELVRVAHQVVLPFVEEGV